MTRVSVDGVQRPKGESFEVGGLDGETDIRIRVSGAAGASTTYTVHCIDRGEFPKLTTVKGAGAMEDLAVFKAAYQPSGWRSWLILMDNNGVPRFRRFIGTRVYTYFRTFADATSPRAGYVYSKLGSGYHPDGVEVVVLDRDFGTVDEDVHILRPYSYTNGHDLMVRPNGDYVLMAYSPTRRDLRFLANEFQWLRNRRGGWFTGRDRVEDGVVQIRDAAGTAKFNWNSWDHMAIEDCVISHRLPDDYAHVNSLGWVDGDILAGFRHCSKILRIDVETGDVVWRAGPSTRTRAEWEAGETLQADRGPAPLDFVNDPLGGFSGNHGGHIAGNGNLIVYDNHTHCRWLRGAPVNTDAPWRCWEGTRAVGYAIDVANGELVFQRDFRLGNGNQGGIAGHVEPLAGGDWLISWSFAPPDNTAVQVDAETNTQKFSMKLQHIAGREIGVVENTRVVSTSPLALASPVEPLEATLVDSSPSHTGGGDRPTVVLAFNQPVVDVAGATSSVEATGVASWTVEPELAAGAPAHAYRFTLAPSGDGPITFALVEDAACGNGGICTADARRLSQTPDWVGVRGPDGVAPGRSIVTVTASGGVPEGAPAVFAVAMAPPSAVGLAVAVEVAATGAVLAGAPPASVTFAAGARRATLSVATQDDRVADGDGAVTAALRAGDGYGVGAPASATVNVEDDDEASWAVAVEPSVLAEGGSATVTVTVANGVTFATEQSVVLSASGTATADDYTLAPVPVRLLAGAPSATATLTAVADGAAEEAETVEVTAHHEGRAVGSAAVTIEASPGSAPGDDARLGSLALSGIQLGVFDAQTRLYAVAVAHAVAATTVTAIAKDGNATVTVAPADADVDTAGHQVALAVGGNAIAVTVTAADGATTRTYTVSVTRAAAPLTARFASVPGHEGAGTAATLRLEFSAPVSTSYATLRDESFAVTDGTVRNALRVDGRSDLWDIEIAPDSDADVGVALPETTDCAASGAVCAADGRRLSHRLEATVAGPLALTPAVAGVPQVGRRLEATLDGTAPAELTHAWLRDGEEIAGATAAAHVLTGADAGARVSVRVSSGGRTATSAATIPVWGLPGNPPLGADEEELLGTVLTVGSTDAYPLRLGGYGRLSKAEFGALDSTALPGGGELSAAFVNDIGDFTLVLPRATAAVEDLTAVWDGYRIGPLVDGASSEGPYVTGKTPQPRAAYLRYLDGSSDGVRVALSVRRKPRPAASVTAVAESVSEGEPALFAVALERAAAAPLVVAVSVTAAGAVLDGAAPASVSFAAGASTARLAVATHDDRVVEGDGSVTVTLLAGDGYELGETTAAAVTVEDDDAATFALTVAPAVLAEGGTSTVTVSIEDGATFADAKTIVLAVTGPAASDYALEPETLELAAGASAATAAFAAVADETDEAPAAARIAALVDGAEVASATVTIRDASADARLAALALSDGDIGAFEAETTVYAAAVAADVAETTVTAQPADAHAAVEIADAAGSTLGTERTSRLAGGTNEIAATVTAEDRATTRTYTVTVTRAEALPWGTHLPERDIALGGDGESTGLWSDGATLWALADWDGGAAQAYELATGARLRSRDLSLDDGFSQTALFSDGITLWAPSFYGGARAYALADGARLAERDLDESLSAAGNERPSGLWSDGSTWYVSNLDDARLYAYAADGTRQEDREFGFRTGDVQGGWPWGLWSDGETLFTSWHGRGRVLAYRLADGARLSGRDIDTGAAGNDDPRDVWSDGETLWVADGADRKVYAYAAPGLVRPAASGLLPVRVASRAHAVPSGDPGAPVSIPDAGLRARIAAALGKAPDAPLGAHELAALTALDARDAGIADLSGLEGAVNLAGLDLGHNPLADLRSLAALGKLEALNLDATGADPWAVASLTGLRLLSLRDNGIGDVSALAGLGRLRALDLAGNAVTDVTPLAGLAPLEALDLRDNRVEDVTPLARLRAMIDVRGNPDASTWLDRDKAK